MQEENKGLTNQSGEIRPQEEAKNQVSKIKRILGLKKVWVTALVVALLVLLSGVAYYYKSLAVAATVNGHPISRLAVVKELEKQGGKDVLDMLVNKQLIANEAQVKGINISQDEVNQEIKKYEDQFNVGGQSLDDTLAAQHMTRGDLKSQIAIQKEIEKLVGDKTNVTDEEVAAYIKDNSLTLPQGQEDAAKTQIKDQLKQQKLSEQSSQLISDLRAKANIKTYVSY